MSGRSILNAIALGGWLFASVVAFMIVAYTSFFGVGVIGLMIWFVCARVDHVRIPTKRATDSERMRPPIPIDGGQGFR